MNSNYDVIIIGSGFGGIAAGVNLKQAGIDRFIILERDEEPGGTWWRNSYPGAQVDVQSHLYSLSFEPYDWTRLFAMQHEILAYTNHVIDKYGLREKTVTRTNVTGLEFDEARAVWQVHTGTGKTYTADFVINASGGLSQPNIPAFPGADKFRGKAMHTAHWDHSFDYRNKRVAVIGSAASAIQVIPAIAPLVKHLTVFQRTPHWILPRPDRALTSIERRTFRQFPALQKAYRDSIYMRLEGRVVAFQYASGLLKLFSQQAVKHIESTIKDPEIQRKVTPDYVMGCKRILLSSDYYPSLNRANVTLLTRESGVKAINESGLETLDGDQVDVDLIVYATGFHASEDVVVYPVKGRGGLEINQAWESYAHAYLGTTVPGFPNLFLLSGPNTGTGHTSQVYMIECQLEYIMRMLKHRRKHGWKTIEVRRDVEEKYNRRLQEKLKTSVWQTGGCQSWYLTKDGHNTTMYPFFTFLFQRECRDFKPREHLIG